MSQNPQWKEGINGDFKLSEDQVVEFNKQFEAMLDSTNKMRQKAMYVDVNREIEEITNPLEMGEKEVKGVLEAVELLFKIFKGTIEETSEDDKEKWRKVFGSIPKEAWETGEIPLHWFREEE